MENNHIAVIMKVAKSCNLNCRYCYEDLSPFLLMPMSIAKECVSQLLRSFSNVELIFHGGEPLLLGTPFFEGILKLETKMLGRGHTISNYVQTNGTLVNDEWIDFFLKNNVGVSVSIDGPSRLHNANRIYRNTKGTFPRVYKNLLKMKKQGIGINALSVVTEETLKNVDEVFNFFSKGLFDKIDFLPSVNCKNPFEAISPRQYGEFMVAVFDLWIKNKKKPSIRFFENIIKNELRIPDSFCVTMFPKQCGTNILTIDHNGDVYPCDDFVGTKAFNLGNVRDKKIVDIIQDFKEGKHYNLINTLPSKCGKCEFLRLCGGGCTFHRCLESKTFDQASCFCEAYRLVFSHVNDWVKKGGLNGTRIIIGI